MKKTTALSQTVLTAMAAVLLCLLLAACGGGGTSSGESAAASSQESQAEAGSKAEEKTESTDSKEETASVPEYSKEDQKLLEETGTITHHEPVESDELTWEFDEASGTLTIKGSGPMKDYYDGFCFDGVTKLYNPHSILSFFFKSTFANYWYESGSPSFIVVSTAKAFPYRTQ